MVQEDGGDPTKRDENLRCSYHRDHEHGTKNCRLSRSSWKNWSAEGDWHSILITHIRQRKRRRQSVMMKSRQRSQKK